MTDPKLESLDLATAIGGEGRKGANSGRGGVSGDPPARKGKEETSGVLGDAGNHPH
jgi:hypothetical protein